MAGLFVAPHEHPPDMDPAGRCGGIHPDRPGDRLSLIRSSKPRFGPSVQTDGRDPAKTRVEDVKSDKVLYCFKGDVLRHKLE